MNKKMREYPESGSVQLTHQMSLMSLSPFWSRLLLWFHISVEHTLLRCYLGRSAGSALGPAGTFCGKAHGDEE